MRVCILYRSNSEYERQVQEFARDFNKAQGGGRKLEFMDLNSREGDDLAKLYDIVQYPAILAIDDNGQLLKAWIGETLPLMNEVAYYTHL